MSPSDDRTSGRLADHALAIVGFLACLALAAVIWRFGPPGRIPTHFDLYGQVNGWNDRPHVAMIVAGLTAGSALIYAAMGLFAGGARRNLKTARLIMVLSAIMMSLLMVASTFGILNSPGHGPTRLLPAGLSVLMLVVGALVGKSSPNPFVGVRTYWSLRSRLSWDKSNRLCGRLFLAIGALGLIGSLVLPPPSVLVAVFAAVIVSSVVTVVESWRVWRTDPDRQRP